MFHTLSKQFLRCGETELQKLASKASSNQHLKHLVMKKAAAYYKVFILCSLLTGSELRETQFVENDESVV